MADKTVLRGAAFGVAVDAKTHVDFMHRHHAIHRFDRTMTFLAGDARPDMRLVHELDEVRQRIDAVPANFEWRLMFIRPRLRDRLNPAQQAVAMASDAARNRRDAGGSRASGVLVAVLAGNLVNARVDAVTEGDRLLDIVARRPGALGKADHAGRSEKEQQRDRNQDAIHRSHWILTRIWRLPRLSPVVRWPPLPSWRRTNGRITNIRVWLPQAQLIIGPSIFP